MKCLHCGTELIHGGDHDGEEGDDYDIVSNLSCPKCRHTYMYIINLIFLLWRSNRSYLKIHESSS